MQSEKGGFFPQKSREAGPKARIEERIINAQVPGEIPTWVVDYQI